MEVKGTGIKTTRDFVKSKFSTRYNEWLGSLSNESQKLYAGALDVGGWFNIDKAYYHPLSKISELFYNNNHKKCGDEIGRYSADIALKGIYKVFLLVATPQYLMKRAGNMMQAFYKPCEIEVMQLSQKQVLFKIKNFEKINLVTEYRAAGWCAKALELCNCKNVIYNFKGNLSLGQSETIIEFTWE